MRLRHVRHQLQLAAVELVQLHGARGVGSDAHGHEALGEGHPLVVVGRVVDLLVDVLDDLRRVGGVHGCEGVRE